MNSPKITSKKPGTNPKGTSSGEATPTDPRPEADQQDWGPLFQLAQEAQKKSYSPYSEFAVGSALLMSDGHTFSGCNVENSSYGATVCSERIAIWKAISELNQPKDSSPLYIKRLLVLSSAKDIVTPCGMCLQVINEFAHETTMIGCFSLNGNKKIFSFNELLPHSFKKSKQWFENSAKS